MKTGHQFWLALILILILVTGCSGGDNSAANPVSPGMDVNQTPAILGSHNPDFHLLGYYEITIDPETCTATVNVSRHALFTVNIMGIINQNPAFLGIQINKITPGADYIDVDVDITLAHPLPGYPEFNCYDARGVFMGDGSAVLDYNNDLVYPVPGTDQYMLDDPDDHDGGGPDGYTRWYNFSEFGPSISDVPLFAYTPGPLSTPDFNGTATLNPYKYFTDSLAPVEDLWAFLQSHGDLHGIFSQSNSATRNYYIRFPSANPLEFGFAFIVDWEGPDIHPANAEEAVACKAEIANDLYFESITTWGGDLIMDVSVFDWDAEAPTGPMDQYNIIIESNVLNTPHQLDDSEMTPVSGGDNFSTYHVELPADLISSINGNEVWVIVEYPDSNYQNVAGVPNLADTDFLAAFFRYDLQVSAQMDNDDPVCNMFIDPGSPMPAEGWDVGIPIMFDASGSYDPDGDPITFEWDFDDDNIFGEDPDDLYTGDPDTPTYIYTFSLKGAVRVKVSDDKGGESICSVIVDITTFQSKNIPLREGVIPLDIGVRETNGDLWVLYEDTEVWVYVRDNWYQYGALQYALPDDGYSFDIEYMDIAPTGFLGVGAGQKYKIFSPGGAMVNKAILDEDTPVRDVASHGISEGIFTEALSFLMGKTIESDPPGNPYVRHYWHMLTPPTYVYDYYSNWCGYNYNVSSGNEGINKTFYDWIKAIEADVDGESIWVIEQPDYRCSRWYKNSFLMVYGGEYFGDGTDSSWVDLRDMARDPNNRFLVLDYENSSPLIKVFTGDLDGGAYIGSFGDSDSINGDPIRIDGSDFDGLACVLHDDTAGISGSWLISVFVPEEMP